MSVDTVQAELQQKDPAITIFKLGDSIATVEEAANQIGVDPDCIAKSLSLYSGDGYMVIVMSGKARLDNKKFKAAFQMKAKMLAFEDVEPMTGHPVGGMSPFGLKGEPAVYLDASLRRHPEVYPSAGSRFHALKIGTEKLAALTGAKWVDVCSVAE